MYSTRGMMYMIDFVIDDLIIARRNRCAPSEYSTCVEISLRNNVYVNICDSDYVKGQKDRGKRVIFALSKPIMADDRILIQVTKRKKKNMGKVKFMIGSSDIEIESLFDAVDHKFKHENLDWYDRCITHLRTMPRLNTKSKGPIDVCECFEVPDPRYEELTPVFESRKVMVPIFNLCQYQTGNVLIKIILYCIGPSVVGTIIYNSPEPPPKLCPYVSSGCVRASGGVSKSDTRKCSECGDKSKLNRDHNRGYSSFNYFFLLQSVASRRRDNIWRCMCSI